MLIISMISICFISWIGIAVISLIGGNLVECIKLPKFLDFKPFNCRLCMTVHLNWVLNTLLAIVFNCWLLFILGIFSTVIIYKLIKDEDEKQFDFKD